MDLDLIENLENQLIDYDLNFSEENNSELENDFIQGNEEIEPQY